MLMQHFTSKDIKLKKRPKSSHKGQNGIAIVIGGSEDYVGAPAFVGMSALAVIRTGADLVKVAAPEKVAWAINCISPDLITIKLKGTKITAKNIARVKKEAADVLAIGNGTGRTKATERAVKEIIKMDKPKVIDADALHMIKIQDVKNAVLTPHGGEMKALLNNSGITKRELQKNLGSNILVEKGYPKTKIWSKDRIVYTDTGHPGMTHGGTGDVLAGIITGLIAQGNDPFMAASTACYTNGKAAEKLAETFGIGYIASDLIQEIPRQLKKHIQLRP